MAVKTFVTGEVLTAANTNTYLANAGLVFVKSQTINSNVSSVPVTSAFSTDYDMYKIMIFGSTGSVIAANIRFALTGQTASSYGTYYYDQYTGTSSGYGRSTAALFLPVGNTDGTSSTSTEFTVNAPFLTQRTTITGSYGGAYSGWFGGVILDTTSSTGFTISTSSGTLTGGTIAVYGYRKA